MSSDPVPSPDDSAVPRGDSGYEAFYMEVAATERGRRFLVEYASRCRRSDAQRLAADVARLDAAFHDGPVQISATFADGLADFAAAVAQIESVLAAGHNPVSDTHFAVERIQDVAGALRRRDVDAALCDMLEAAAGEIGDAIVRHDAATGRVSSAIALLQDLALRASDVIARVGAPAPGVDRLAQAPSPHSSTQSLNDPVERPADAAQAAPADLRFDNTGQDRASGFAEAPPAGGDGDRSDARVLQALPEIRARAWLDEYANNVSEPLSLPIPSPLDGEQQDNPPSTPRAPGADTITNSRAALYDSVSALHAISEDELIALFS
jgi:hypothetical protein